jgi:hypothetical protein
LKKLAFLAALLLASTAQAQTPAPTPPAPVTGTVLEQSNEYRFQLDLAVNPQALAKLLPAGWEPAIAAQGPAKDCNLRLIFIDRVNVLDGNARVLPPGKDIAVYLEVPVRQVGGTATGRMVLAGISENGSATAATFGTLVKASRASASRSIATANGNTTVTEDWALTGAGGESATLHVKYVRGPANRAASEVRFYNPANPAQLLVARTEQETDIARNITTTPPDRVSEFSFKVGGGKFAPLFDGTEKALSWDSQPTYRRAIVQPSP